MVIGAGEVNHLTGDHRGRKERAVTLQLPYGDDQVIVEKIRREFPVVSVI
jgi:hypothetical protein